MKKASFISMKSKSRNCNLTEDATSKTKESSGKKLGKKYYVQPNRVFCPDNNRE